ncbi:MAG TPA: nucleoside-diphosphate sugar epimerase/dehydratase, partial [Bryobacteraceae bacterium]
MSRSRKLSNVRRLAVVLAHASVAGVSVLTAFLLRFDFGLPKTEFAHFQIALLIAIPIKVLIFQLTGLQRGWWRFAGLGDVYRLTFANVAASVLFTCAVWLSVGAAFPRSVYALDFLLCFLLTCEMRFASRILKELRAGLRSVPGGKGVLIYGAGAAGMTLVREIRSNPSLRLHVLGFLDDDPQKRHDAVMGIRILGTGRQAAKVVARLRSRNRKVNEVIIAIPSATGKQMREAVANCRSAGLPCKTIPGLGDILTNKVLSGQIREVSIGDLLGRESVHLEEAAIRKHLAGKAVLVTGGAGSIGSEICRQIATLGARKLVIFDQAESDLFRVELELKRLPSTAEIIIALGDIRDYKRVEDVIVRHSIQLVFHAAAYKHVPMMEAHLFEAIRNNVFGTWNVVRAANRHAVSGFVMISSDKAVNPTSIMGTTKRVSELIVSAMSGDRPGQTTFVSVRFGNVLGSNGSVIPLFQSQIASGGPVTVTHPDIRRYFMTTREAVQLVLQASTMGHGSETFVLDMGEPIRIIDLARNMIRLTGLEPDEDIDIRIVGLRPGEKLFEELVTDTDRVLPTRHEKIKICQTMKPNRERIVTWLSALERLLAERDATAVKIH